MIPPGARARGASFVALLSVGFALLVVALLVVALLIVACGAEEAPGPDVPPNIVMIIGDDHGYPDFGFMGSQQVATPNLDRLAAKGTVFTHTYVTASICGPSLRSLATGLHPMQHAMRVRSLASQGVIRELDHEMQDFDTLPRRLRDAGYRGYQAGKFFGGRFDVAGFADGTNVAGADLSFGGPGRRTIGRKTMAPVIEFLDAAQDDLFFLWFAPMLPHKPFNAPDEFVAPYRDRDLPGQVRGYLANVTRFDASVGELLDALEARGLRENTLVVYLADNGWEPAPKSEQHSDWDSDGSRGKRSMYELGFRTPMILSWPGRIPAGARDDSIVSAVDLVPTLLDYGLAETITGRLGHSLRPHVEGTGAWPRIAAYAAMSSARPSLEHPDRLASGELRAARMIRERDWTYIHYGKSGFEELYDMRADPEQRSNVAKQHSDEATRLKAELDGWGDRAREQYGESARRPAS